MQTSIITTQTGEIIYIRIIPAPLCFRGYTQVDADGHYNVYINADLAPEIQEEALADELEHITHRDFEDESPGSLIELKRKLIKLGRS